MSAVSEQDIDSAILRAGSVDYLDVWFISGLVEDLVGSAKSDAVELAVEAIGRLLSQGALRAGDLQPPGEFVPWPDDPVAALHRIRAAVRQIEGEPAVGEIAWFEVPEARGG
jgi:hypothetical protein